MCDSKCLLGVVYRHSHMQTAEQFLDDFLKCLDSLNKDSKYYYILGDFSIYLEIEKIFLFQCAISIC